MDSEQSFVDVRRASFGYVPKKGVLAALSGKPMLPYSVLQDLSLQLGSGDQVTVFGPAGSGKSTLLRLLTGALTPTSGTVRVNNRKPFENKGAAAGYVSSEESEPRGDTTYEVLHSFGKTHQTSHIPAQITEIAEIAELTGFLSRPASLLSTSERIRLNIARAALSAAPLILLDDVTDVLGPVNTAQLVERLFIGRTVIYATRSAADAEKLGRSLVLLHNGRLAQHGTREELASAVACERVIEIWVEGLRYDLLRALKKHPGVLSVQLVPSDSFSGQKLRIRLRSSNYLPALYDTVSQAELVRVEELPPSLSDIIDKLKT